MLAELCDLRAHCDAAIAILARLEPVLAAWQAGQEGAAAEPPQEAAVEPPGAPPAPSAPPRVARKARSSPGEAKRRGDGADRAATPVSGVCEDCGATFVTKARGGQRQRFCSTSCRNRANARQRRHAAPAAAEPEPAAAEPEPASYEALPDYVAGRPSRVPVDDSLHSDPELLKPPALPWQT